MADEVRVIAMVFVVFVVAAAFQLAGGSAALSGLAQVLAAAAGLVSVLGRQRP